MYFVVILVTGGYRSDEANLTSTEILYSNGSYMCNIEELPESRFLHSQNGWVVCGGQNRDETFETCLTFTKGEWIQSHSLKYPRTASTGHYGIPSKNKKYRFCFTVGGSFSKLNCYIHLKLKYLR